MKPPLKSLKGNGKRSPDALVDARIDEIIAIFSAQANISKYALRKRLTKEWNCHWRTVDTIAVRAREELLKRLKRDKEEFRCDALTSLERETQHPDAKVRLAAWAQIREMCGLDEARRTEISGPKGGPIVTKEENILANLSPGALSRLIENLEKDIAETKPPETPPNAG
jgi:hypothetical protein